MLVQGGKKMRCEKPVKIIEILRLHERGHSQREIALSVKCARSTVGAIIQRCFEHALTYEKAASMADDAIKDLLYPKSFGTRLLRPEPNWQEIHNRLISHKRLNLQYVWEECRLSNPNGLSYSQFCRRYNKWLSEAGQKVVMVQSREPGRELFVDWMGDRLFCVTDPTTGEVFEAHFFVATLGDSGYPYVEAFPDEKLDNWIQAHIHALEWLGGVPKVIVPDNCKTAVSKPGYYNPQINPVYWDLAKHYDLAVIPTRVRRPQDKACVESTIGFLETWLLEWLRSQRFFSFEALNTEIRQRIEELASKPFKHRLGSRALVYEEIDKPALRPLPPVRFEYAEYIIRRVPSNYHVDHNRFYYSVPHHLYRQQVTLRVTSHTVEIINSNRERVAIHQRQYSGSRYITNQEHMPEKHRLQAQKDQFDGSRYRRWAQSIGVNTFTVIDTMLKAYHVEEVSYRSCMGLLQKSKLYGHDRMEAACGKAVLLRSCTYTTVTNILKNSQDKMSMAQPSAPVLSHKNIRGASAFS